MKLVAAIVLLCSACGTSAPPAEPPKNETPIESLRCKTAVEQASASVKLDKHDVTMAIGTCEQADWSRPARECVAAVHSGEDLAACGTKFGLGNHGMFAEHSIAKAMAAMSRFRDEMCGCKDTACAQKVSDAMAKWGQEESKNFSEPPRMSEDDTKRATELGEQMGRCMQAAMSATP